MSIRSRSFVPTLGFCAALMFLAPSLGSAATTQTTVVPNYGQKNTLSWINPPAGDFKTITVVRGVSAVPTSLLDGVSVYTGTADRFIDVVPDGSAFKYTVFALRTDGTMTSLPFTFMTGAYVPPTPVVTYPVPAPTPWVPTSVGGANAPTFSRTLTVGMSGNDVRTLQRILNALDYTISTSGTGSMGQESTYFGKGTQVAVRKFQCANMRICSGSPTTNGYGLVGKSTRAKLIAVFMASGKTVKAGEVK